MLWLMAYSVARWFNTHKVSFLACVVVVNLDPNTYYESLLDRVMLGYDIQLMTTVFLPQIG